MNSDTTMQKSTGSHWHGGQVIIEETKTDKFR